MTITVTMYDYGVVFSGEVFTIQELSGFKTTSNINRLHCTLYKHPSVMLYFVFTATS